MWVLGLGVWLNGSCSLFCSLVFSLTCGCEFTVVCLCYSYLITIQYEMRYGVVYLVRRVVVGDCLVEGCHVSYPTKE